MERIQPIIDNLWERIQRYFENKTRRNWTIAIFLLIVGSLILDVPTPHVSIAAEPLWPTNAFFTNSLLTTFIVDLILIGLAFAARSQIKEIPTGLGNFMEMVVESLYNLTESVAGKNARKFFPWVATIFLFVIISNYSGLIPGVGSIGLEYADADAYHALLEGDAAGHADVIVTEDAVVVAEAEHGAEAEHAAEAEHGAAAESVTETEAEHGTEAVATAEGEHGEAAEDAHHSLFVPLFRAPSADLNVTFALALITMILVQYFGFQSLGSNYFTKFFNFNTGKGFMRGIFAFSGILELVSEFAKIISFAFRLFGNIFAGEVLLGVMAFLVAFLVPVAFYGLELFVGFIQALVFMMLAVVFFSTAVVSHGDHGDDHGEHH